MTSDPPTSSPDRKRISVHHSTYTQNNVDVAVVRRDRLSTVQSMTSGRTRRSRPGSWRWTRAAPVRSATPSTSRHPQEVPYLVCLQSFCVVGFTYLLIGRPSPEMEMTAVIIINQRTLLSNSSNISSRCRLTRRPPVALEVLPRHALYKSTYLLTSIYCCQWTISTLSFRCLVFTLVYQAKSPCDWRLLKTIICFDASANNMRRRHYVFWSSVWLSVRLIILWTLKFYFLVQIHIYCYPSICHKIILR